MSDAITTNGRVRIDFKSLIAPGLVQSHNDILASRDTDPTSPTYGQYLREYWLRGGRGCVDGDTLIDTPNGQVKIRDFKGGLIHTFDGNRVLESYACKAIRYTEEDLYEVRTDNGTSVLCTDEHRFLSNRGWVETKHLACGDAILLSKNQASFADKRDLSNEDESVYRMPSSGHRSSCILRQPSVLLLDGKFSHDFQAKHCEESQLKLREDVLHSMRTLLSCLYHYWHDYRLCDGQLPKEGETYRDVLRQLTDAPRHIQDDLHEDVQVGGENDNQTSQCEHHLSKQDLLLHEEDKCFGEKGSEILRTLSESLSVIFPSVRISQKSEDLGEHIQQVAQLVLLSTEHLDFWACGLCEMEFCEPKNHQVCEILQVLSDMLQRRVDDVSYSDSFVVREDSVSRALHRAEKLTFTRVESVEFRRRDYYYDLFVPFYNNYISNGVVSHNSCKSSLVSLEIVRHIVESPKSNCVVFVKVAENIRDSVYKQIIWAIDHLELTHFFKCTTSPFRCVYLPTGQEILFRGLDKAGKIKGIKPTVGYFDMIWFEELTEFSGMEDCRSVVQSVLRGGDEDDDDIGENVRTWEFYSYNPPPTIANWVNVESNRVVPGRKVYDSNYLTVPPRWLRKDFFVRAEILKKSNPRAYAHEYLGWVTGTGGNIFNNLEIRSITDEEIYTRFDNRCFGIDWGFANDPFVWLAMNYDRDRRILYIFDEIVCLGKRTQETAEMVRKKMERIGGGCTVFADCAEPDSIADFNAWGVRCEGCPKPHSSKFSGRDYEFKALQDLTKIVIDPKYCQKTAEEFQRLEYPKTPHGDFRSEYPHSDPGDACVVGSTQIHTDDGCVPIESLVGTEGELESYDEQSGQVCFAGYKNVRKTRENAEVIRVLTDRGSIDCTPDHKILTVNRGWIESGSLTREDDVQYRGTGARLLNVQTIVRRKDVYDLEVPTMHCFLVNGGIVVHNCRYGTFWKFREAGILTI